MDTLPRQVHVVLIHRVTGLPQPTVTTQRVEIRRTRPVTQGRVRGAVNVTIGLASHFQIQLRCVKKAMGLNARCA